MMAAGSSLFVSYTVRRKGSQVSGCLKDSQVSGPVCLFKIFSSHSSPHNAVCCHVLNITNMAGTPVGAIHCLEECKAADRPVWRAPFKTEGDQGHPF
jgi:hypothetical protein